MKIAHVTIDPATANHLALVTGDEFGIAHLQAGQVLRCGAYRFEVLERAKDYPEAPEPTVALRLRGEQHPPHEGMVVHQATELLTDEEFETAVQHLIMAERMLLGIDADGVLSRLARADAVVVTGPVLAQVAGACNTVEQIARAVQAALLRLPSSSRAADVQRYASELTRVTAAG